MALFPRRCREVVLVVLRQVHFSEFPEVFWPAYLILWCTSCQAFCIAPFATKVHGHDWCYETILGIQDRATPRRRRPSRESTGADGSSTSQRLTRGALAARKGWNGRTKARWIARVGPQASFPVTVACLVLAQRSYSNWGSWWSSHSKTSGDNLWSRQDHSWTEETAR